MPGASGFQISTHTPAPTTITSPPCSTCRNSRNPSGIEESLPRPANCTALCRVDKSRLSKLDLLDASLELALTSHLALTSSTPSSSFLACQPVRIPQTETAGPFRQPECSQRRPPSTDRPARSGRRRSHGNVRRAFLGKLAWDEFLRCRHVARPRDSSRSIPPSQGQAAI